MATPFAPYASIRMKWEKPTSVSTNLREGIATTVVIIVIEAYLDVYGPSGEQPLGGRSIGAATMEGNITRWVQIPTGASWLENGSSWSWVDTGIRPDGLPRGEKMDAFKGDLSLLPSTTKGELGYATIATLSNEGGIDAIVSQFAGDEFTGTFVAGR